MASSHLEKELLCSICLSIYTDPVMLKCGHNYCRDCIDCGLDTQERSGGYFCPFCRKMFQERPALLRNITLRNIAETVKTQDEASEMKKKKLRNVMPKLMTEREKTEKRVQSLQERRRNGQGKADDETERVTVLFRDFRSRLEDLEKRVLSEISGQVERVLLSLSDMIQQLEIKKVKLSGEMRHIEMLCNMTDPLTVLQESDTGDLCDTEDGDDEDRERHDKLLHDGGDLDVAGISRTLHTCLSVIMSGLNVQSSCYSTLSKRVITQFKAELFRPCAQPIPTIERLHPQAGRPNIWQQTLKKHGVTDILLDVSTAGNNLHISNDRKTASFSSSHQNRPDTPKRFECPQVLSNQSISSGQFYWEVDVRGSGIWRVGMCYTSIDKRGDQSLIGYNKKSWCLEKWGHSQYSMIHDKKEIPLTSNMSSNRVRIDLDYELGRISFYDLCSPIQHLYTFTATFTEPLHAALWVLGGSIRFTGWRVCVV
ncbi:E3 ubiquitin-protein ligase TRIM39-like [Rana temporaria]|uniref:E3 ubiquitin-protein ligase TRIM39-like n=1 Tax=Rana temporaria TaxID=8407 RepID=UPI001AAD9ABB|nr:E3 ubiquitin-protein ligase TRIM39-like [Rana temporaria]